MIGVTEKGTTSVELVAEGRGGHASTPARNGPTARLARAILNVEKAPFPASAPAPTLEMMRRIAPHLPLAVRPVLGPLLSRADRIAPVVTRALVAAGPEAAATTRTTVATTTLSGSPAINVIASTAKAGLNVRVMVGDTVAGVVEHLRRAVDDDSIRIDVLEAGEASPVSPMDEPFELLEACIGEVFPDAVATPYVMMAATDSRHFTAISEHVYRFAPFPDDQGPAPGDPLLRRAHRRGRPRRRRPLVRPADREAAVMSTTASPSATTAAKGLATIVGFLVMVEFASGILQGYYTPIYPQIAEHLAIHEGDINWFEAAQLIVSALCIPLLARARGPRRAQEGAAGLDRRHRARVVVAGLRARLHQLPRGLGDPGRVRRVAAARDRDHPPPHPRLRAPGAAHPPRRAAILVGSLELAVIVGALSSGLLVDTLDMNLLLALPAVVVTAVLFVIWAGIEQVPGEDSGGIDWTGLALVTVALGVLMGGLVWLRLDGPGSLRGWLTIAVSLPVFAAFWRFEQRHHEPIVDVRLLSSPAQWAGAGDRVPVRHPGARRQIPLSTYAQADPAERGYGLGADPAFISTLIGLYVVTLAIGAFTLPLTTRLLGGVRRALVVASALVGTGYALWIPFHDETWQALLNMGRRRTRVGGAGRRPPRGRGRRRAS